MFLDLLFRFRRPASLVALVNAVPENYRFMVNPGTGWEPAPGVSIVYEGLNPLKLYDGTPEEGVDPEDWADPPVFSTAWHVNMRIEDPIYSRLLLDRGDPDTALDKNRIRRWLRNNGAEEQDANGFVWWRWTQGAEWVDIMRVKPKHRRGIWLGDEENPDV